MARLSRPSGEAGAALGGGPAGPADRLHLGLNRNASLKVVIPDVSQDLLDYLDITFSDRICGDWTTIEEVREAIGARKVVDHLRRLHEEQEQDHVPGGQ